MSTGPVLMQFPNLTVYTLSTTHLLAMKLSAWRDDVDVGDAKLLLSQLANDAQSVWKAVEPFVVPGREVKAQLAFADLWENLHGPA